MLRKRQVGSSVGSFSLAGNPLRCSFRPSMAAAGLVVLLSCLHGPEAESAPHGQDSPPSTSAAAGEVSAEQRKLAHFVASRYRRSLDDVQEFVVHAFQTASEFRLDPLLILAIVGIESSFDPNARSPKGAQGLMQVLTRVHRDKFAPFGGTSAAFDPVANLKVGSQILKDYLVREGTIERALKSYVGAALLPHDFGYGRKVLSERERLAKAAGAPALGTDTMSASASSGTKAPGTEKQAMAVAAPEKPAKAPKETARSDPDAPPRVDAVRAVAASGPDAVPDAAAPALEVSPPRNPGPPAEAARAAGAQETPAAPPRLVEPGEAGVAPTVLDAAGHSSETGLDAGLAEETTRPASAPAAAATPAGSLLETAAIGMLASGSEVDEELLSLPEL